MSEMTAAALSAAKLTQLTAEVVSAYVAKNNVPASELPNLLHSVHAALGGLGSTNEHPKDGPLVPAVPIKKSITDDYLISLENGQHFRSLKRHLMTTYKMTPQQYRETWGLPKDYPMVAPGYAKARSALAKNLGLGRKSYATPMPEPQVSPAPEPPPAKKPGRKRRIEAAEQAPTNLARGLSIRMMELAVSKPTVGHRGGPLRGLLTSALDSRANYKGADGH